MGALPLRRAARTDANQTAVVDAFRALGVNVVSLAAHGKGLPDLLISRRNDKGHCWLVEVKDGSKPPSETELTKAQKEFHATWPTRIFVCKSIVEVPGIVKELG